MKKTIFVFKNAPKSVRTAGIVALILAVIAILIPVIGANNAINGPLLKIPVIELLADEMDLDDMTAEIEEVLEWLEENEQTMSAEDFAEFEDEYGMSVQDFKKLMDLDSLSLSTMGTVMASLAAGSGEEETVSLVFSVLTGVIGGFAGLLALFVALSALFMNKGWFITAVVLAPGFFLTFIGAVWYVVFLGLCIAFCILTSKVKKAYKAFKNQPKQQVVEEVAEVAIPAAPAADGAAVASSDADALAALAALADAASEDQKN